MGRRSDAENFRIAVADAGGKIANGALQQILGWDDDKYWKIHQLQLEAGRIARGRGRGGTVILVDVADPTAPADIAVESEIVPTVSDSAIVQPEDMPAGAFQRELDLYEPALDQLQRNWRQRRQLDDCYCELTAMQGRRDTGGSWSRPDITIVGYKKYEYLPEKILEVFSFEIKAVTDISIKGVLEALAHRECATRSYVVYYTGGRDISEFPEAIRIEELAIRHGVGVFVAPDIEDFSSWEELVVASRANPDPDALEIFIKRTLSDSARTRLRKWF